MPQWAALIGGVVAVVLVAGLVMSAVVVRIWLLRKRRNEANPEHEDDEWKSRTCDAVTTELCSQREIQVRLSEPVSMSTKCGSKRIQA